MTTSPAPRASHREGSAAWTSGRPLGQGLHGGADAKIGSTRTTGTESLNCGTPRREANAGARFIQPGQKSKGAADRVVQAGRPASQSGI